MKSILLFTSLLSLTALPALSESVGKLSFFVGAVTVQSKAAAEAKAAKLNQPVSDGDRIVTDKADRAEITLKDGSVLRIAELSDIIIACPNGKTVSPSIQKGKLWGNIKKLGQRSYDFEVSTGTATAAIRGTVFRMEDDPADSLTKVAVYDGKVAVGPSVELKKVLEKSGERKEVSGPSEVPGPFEVSLMDWVTIVKGQQINVQKGGKYSQFKFNQKKDAEDDWVKFNKERDAAVPIQHEE
jgi:ferric-dicitrate binding protein FerR (iron transport regulator)